MESFKIMEKSNGEILFYIFKKSLAEVRFYFHLQYFKTLLERVLSHEVTLVRKCKCTSTTTSEIKISNLVKISKNACSKLITKN